MKKKGDFSRVFSNSFFLILNEIVRASVNLAIIVMLVRYFDLQTFGDYCFIFALCNIFQVIVGMGMNSIIIRDVAKKPESSGQVFDASLYLRIVLSFIAFGAIALSINLASLSPEVVRATYICSVGVISLFFCNLCFSVFQGHQRMEFVAIVGIISNMVYLIATLGFIRFGADLGEIFFPVLIGNVVGFAIGFYIISKKFFVPRFKLDLSVCHYLLKESYLIGIGRILRRAGFRVHTILIKMIKGSIDVAFFSGPHRLFLQLTFIPRNIAISLFPVFSQRYEKGANSLDFAFEECFKIFVVFLTPLVICLFFFAEHTVILLFGEKLHKSIPLFKILSITWGFMFLSFLFINILIAIGKQSLATLCIAWTLIVNVVLDIILIPIMGFIGAGIAAFVAEGVLTFSTYRVTARHLVGLPLRRLLVGPTMGGLFLVFLCYVGSKVSFMALFSLMTVGLVGYMGLLILCKTLTSREYRWAKEILSDFSAPVLARHRKPLNPGNHVCGDRCDEE